MSRQTDAGTATVTQVCAAFGLSRAAYSAARHPARARKGRVVRLPRRPRHASAEAVLAAIRAGVDREPAWGVRKVWATLRREGLRVSRRGWALRHAEGLVLARDREPGEPTRGHVAGPEPNRRLATDLTTTWTRRDGVVAIVPTLDGGCRSLLGLEVTTDQTGPAVLASVEAALLAAFGSPTAVPAGVELRSDHGPQYTGADCAAPVARWGLTHTFAPVGRPTGNAVGERCIRPMKEEVSWLRDWESADKLREALQAWMIRDNPTRPHQALAWQTPAERRAEKLGGVAAAA